jgi:hypothetical protein
MLLIDDRSLMLACLIPFCFSFCQRHTQPPLSRRDGVGVVPGWPV